MKTKVRISGIIMAMALVGCTQEEVFDNGTGLKELNVKVEGYRVSSRVGFTDGDADFFWTKGDKIGTTTTQSSTFQGMTLEGEGGSASGKFTGSMSGNPDGYAVYPYGELGRHSVSEDILSYTLPASYTYTTLDATYAKIDGNSYNAPMWGKVTNSSASFKHLGGVIAFSVNGLPENTSGKFILTATNKINGTFTATLTESEPSIATSSTDVAAEKTVTIKFSTAEGQTSGYFYVPVPTGTLGNLMLAIVDADDNELASGAWDNITIKRTDIRRATIGEQSITAGMIREVTAIENITDEVLTSEEEKLTVQISEEVKGTENTISIPSTLQTNVTTFSFTSIAEDAVITIENASESSYTGQIIIEIPENETIPTVNAYIPEGEVYIKQGTVTTLVTSSAANTTIIGSKATVGTLTVKQGNVRIEAGGAVETINRSDDNSDVVTYVIYEAATAPEIAFGENQPIVLVSAGEWDLKKAIADANTSSYQLQNDIVLVEPLTIQSGKTFTLDLNGKTISQEKECTKSYEMIANNGTLTITGNGKISFKDTGAGDPTFGWGSYTIRNSGYLTVENGTIEHLGEQNFATHMICAIFQYSGSSIIKDGTVSTPAYRSARLWKGNMTIEGGIFDGQLWVQSVDDSAELTIKNGTFSPNGGDGSSVFVGNVTTSNVHHTVKFNVTGGYFETKIGCSDTEKLTGNLVTGGIFTELAKTNTNSNLLAAGYEFEENEDGTYTPTPAFVKTSETSYEVYSVEGLKIFRDAVNNGTSFAGYTIYLMNELNLNNEEWVPIGTEDNNFEGNFDGNNKVIKNLTITNHQNTSDGYAYIGLFGVTAGSEAQSNWIKNLTIENVEISSEGQIVAAAIAYPYYTDIESITVKGNINIKGGNYTAGVLGYTRRCVEAKNLVIEGNQGSSISGTTTVGGVISDIQMNGGLTANYTNFKASGLAISGTKSVGGISGIISSQTLDGATVENITLQGEGQVGIISGSMGSSSILKNLSINNVSGATAVIGASYDNAKPIEAKIGDQYYATLVDDAWTKAKDGETITLLTNVTLTENLTISEEQNLIVDLNGKTISQEKAQTDTYAMLINKGTLVIMDSATGGKITYKDITQYTADVNYASNTIRNEGTLTLKSGTIENTSADDVMNYGYPHAIDVYQGSTTNIEGGTVKSENYDCIRMFCNSTTLATTVNISDGNIINRVTFQNPGSNTAGCGVLNITGGTFTSTTEKVNVRLLNFSTDVSNMKATISGGTFDVGVGISNYCSWTSNWDWLTIENNAINKVE